jgi:hypothetical protein
VEECLLVIVIWSARRLMRHLRLDPAIALFSVIPWLWLPSRRCLPSVMDI